MVEHLPHHCKLVGSIPATGEGRGRKKEKSYFFRKTAILNKGLIKLATEAIFLVMSLL
jgi:hypothetical protein